MTFAVRAQLPLEWASGHGAGTPHFSFERVACPLRQHTMRATICALALCLLPSCALLTGPIDRMVAAQELSLAEWEARQLEAQEDASLTADERLEAQREAWGDYRRESSENMAQGLGELKAGIELIGEGAKGAVVSAGGGLGLTLMEQVLGAITGLTGAVGGGYGVKRAAASQVNKERDNRRLNRGEPV